jgi:gamma-glutamylaminecyclotransferase
MSEFNDNGKIRVFVYGTLKKGHGNHVLIESANGVFMGYDAVTGPYKMCDMIGFPGAYHPGDGSMSKTLYGELYAMEPEGLATLDMLEGHPNFYKREKLWTKNGKRAWMYFLSPRYLSQTPALKMPDREIKSGIWRASKEELAHWEAQDAA